MNPLKELKNIYILGIIFLVSLTIILFDRYQFTTMDDIKLHTYILYFLMITSFFGFSYLTKLKLDKKKGKYISKLDKIINISYILILFIGSLVIAFGLLFSSAYVALPADSTIEEVRRFIEQYKIIILGRNLYLNALIVQLLTTLAFAFYHLFKVFKSDK